MAFRTYYEGTQVTPAVTEMVDTITKIINLVNQLSVLRDTQAAIYIDLEGNNLGRHGTVSLLTLMVDPQPHDKRTVYLVDVTTLGKAAFSVAGHDGLTLKDILETPKICKVLFDVRNDSDALYAHFDIKLQGIEDVQLMEVASRSPMESDEYLNGLARCIKCCAPISYEEKIVWERAKENGRNMFNKDNKDAYSVFDMRPLPEDLVAYCTGDVQYLPSLREVFWKNLSPYWKQCVLYESQRRVLESQCVWFEPTGTGKALAPWFDHAARWSGTDLLEWYEQYFDEQREYGYCLTIPSPTKHNDSEDTDETSWSDGSGRPDWVPVMEDGTPIRF